MKTIKQALILLLMLLYCVSVKSHDFEVNGIYYNLLSLEDLTVEVTYKGDYYSSYTNRYTGDIIIPSTVTYKSKTLTVTKIGDNAFRYCSELTSIEIPSSVTRMGGWAFNDCTGLNKVFISNLSAWCNIDLDYYCPSNPLSYAKKLYLNGELVTDLVIPNDVTVIKRQAFYGFSGFTSVTIPNSVTTIESSAFNGCSGLKKVELNCTKIDSWFIGETSIEEVVLGNNVKSIGSYAFSGCSGLYSIKIPNSVTSIGSYAFEECSSLASITIPNSVTSIGSYIFYGCSMLRSVTIGNSVTRISDCAFYNCPRLYSVTIPNSVTSIGSSAFRGCSGLYSITIPNSVTSIGSYAFEECSSLRKVELNCTTIGSWFKGKSSIKEVVLGNNVISIEDNAFRECSNLTNITIGNSVTSIGDYALNGCSELKSICLMATTPPHAGHYNFTNKHYLSTILQVPHGSLSTYQDATIWKDFWDIKEFYIDKYFYIRYFVDNVLFETDSIKHGAEIKLLDEPTKEGYTFSGWSEAPETMPAHDITIEGVFNVNYHAVTYIVDGELLATDSVAYGSELILRDEPTKEGHTFSGWSEAPATMPAKDITIEGSFAVNSYIVTYLVDGEEYAKYTLEYGTEVPIPEVSSKVGYTFNWTDEIPAIVPANNITIKGAFTVNYYTVTYIVDGEVWATDSMAYGSEVVLRDEPTRIGYTFSGWSEAPATMPAGNITINGTFSVNSYTVTFTVDGEVYKNISVEYGTEIELPTVPEKEGYTFSGWENVPERMPANDIIIEGSYIANTAIEQIYLDLEKNKIYNMKGLRITETDKLTRGIYIVNGKKIFVK